VGTFKKPRKDLPVQPDRRSSSGNSPRPGEGLLTELVYRKMDKQACSTGGGEFPGETRTESVENAKQPPRCNKLRQDRYIAQGRKAEQKGESPTGPGNKTSKKSYKREKASGSEGDP